MTPDESYLLAIVGRELYSVTLVGNPAPMVSNLGHRMRQPVPGDLVLEVSRFAGMEPGKFDADSIGRLLRVEGDRFVVEPLHAPGTEQGWQNASFVALPDKNGWLNGQT